MTFAYPWLLALLPLPLLLRWILPPHSGQTTAVRIPMFDMVAAAGQIEPGLGGSVRTRSLFAACIHIVCWVAIVAALARPQVLLPPVVRDVATRDLMLAIDLSGSMETEDFTDPSGQSIDRLAAVKLVLLDFLEQRAGDRVGMIVFGTGAFVQIPFTEDLDVCRELVTDLEVRMAGPKTALGDAIGLAINVFQRSELDDKVLIALTDGNDTGSRIPPAEAAQIAADNGIVIHTIGVGDPEAAGEELLDEEALEAIAEASGGEYFFAADRDALANVYRQIDAINTRDLETISHRPKRDLYFWPLALAFLLSLTVAVRPTVRSLLARSTTASEGAPML